MRSRRHSADVEALIATEAERVRRIRTAETRPEIDPAVPEPIDDTYEIVPSAEYNRAADEAINAALDDEDGIDAPFDAAMDLAIRQDGRVRRHRETEPTVRMRTPTDAELFDESQERLAALKGG